MKWIDWVIVSLLLLIGLVCLSMSLTLTTDENFIISLLKICLWVGIPSLTIGLIFLLFKKRK
ncbi:hypothetical protein BpOF4_20294 (plasmid) [Alkalihalophilus pseudofirmus OF4]|uniref:Uncharacterized protein n=3 Tax=Bacillaceae TaxID=186817 RepID=D3G130_ALKPO|nr:MULTISPECIES: hypothetical protein [Bacillaceae]ADC52056.1 hypothetical protein BpOF4_20294 [Alkalihalophilus pseudofirmus OF4]KGA97968.1 hypothetical protein BALCAV_0207375 [Alkalihalobacillus alcalophilus ATCC 27647 = CGMCC 1.3604]KHF37885.1 hypothetical protein LQ50_24765 [Halalkalibacter okhensis]MED1562746.1 hypothetical protein [Alkalihalobacillus alcalophilus]THG92379.1 hypothetical protein AJ85_13145 [Alkalihalobacillus alcalophilus ATCC 27647 = CGMCC 1.3604]